MTQFHFWSRCHFEQKIKPKNLGKGAKEISYMGKKFAYRYANKKRLQFSFDTQIKQCLSGQNDLVIRMTQIFNLKMSVQCKHKENVAFIYEINILTHNFHYEFGSISISTVQLGKLQCFNFRDSQSSLRLKETAGVYLRESSQHESSLPPPCIVRKDPRVPHTARRGA